MAGVGEGRGSRMPRMNRITRIRKEWMLPGKLEVALALRDLGIDVIEAGFPIASPGDFEAVQAIGRQVEGVVICGLARCNPEDIDRAREALGDAERARIHVFLATSAIHR